MDRRWLIGGLAASLVLNVFVVGAAIAFLAVRPEHDGARARVAAAEAQLDPEHRAAYRQMLKREGRAARPLFREAKAARREAAGLFAEPAYDRAAVAAALDRSRRAEFLGRAQLENAMLDFGQGLTPRERAALAVNLRRGLTGGRGHGGRRDARPAPRPAASPR